MEKKTEIKISSLIVKVTSQSTDLDNFYNKHAGSSDEYLDRHIFTGIYISEMCPLDRKL